MNFRVHRERTQNNTAARMKNGIQLTLTLLSSPCEGLESSRFRVVAVHQFIQWWVQDKMLGTLFFSPRGE
jgi:hypothetical protein